MNADERELPHDVFDLARVDIVFLDLRQHAIEVTLTERALVVGKLDQRQLGIDVTQERGSLDAHVLGLESRRPGWLRALVLQELFDLGKILLDGLLPGFQSIDLFSQRLVIRGGLSSPRASPEQQQPHNPKADPLIFMAYCRHYTSPFSVLSLP